MSEFLGLQRWSALQQSSTLGSNTALRSGPGSPGMATFSGARQDLASAYRMAARNLRRQARRGGARGTQAALELVNLTKDAQNNGFRTGGLSRYAERSNRDMAAFNSMLQGAQRNEAATANIDSLLENGPPAPTDDPSLVGDPREYRELRGGPKLGQMIKLDPVRSEDPNFVGPPTPNDAVYRGNPNTGVTPAAGNNAGFDGVQYGRALTDNQLQRQFLDSRLGQTIQGGGDVAGLEQEAARLGVNTTDFRRRTNWWAKRFQ